MKNLNKTKYLHSVSIIKFNSGLKILIFGFFLKITIFLDLNSTQSNRNSSGGIAWINSAFKKHRNKLRMNFHFFLEEE